MYVWKYKNDKQAGHLNMSINDVNDQDKLADKEKHNLVAVPLNEFLQMKLPPREFLLAPWLPKAGVCLVYAERGVGKTFFALEIAVAIATGRNFLSFSAPRPAKVLYIDGEMPANSMQERLNMIIERYNFNKNIKYLKIITPDLQEDFMPDLSTLDGQQSIKPYTDEADFIIVDNISTLGGDSKENESQSWIPLQKWALSLRKQGKTILFIHHAGKNGTQRGTSKREDILDTSIALKRPSDYEPSSGACFEIHFKKSRGLIGDAVNPICCTLSDTGWEYRSLENSNYLKAVELYNGGYKQIEICEKLQLSKGQISKLIRKGLVTGDIKTKTKN